MRWGVLAAPTGMLLCAARGASRNAAVPCFPGRSGLRRRRSTGGATGAKTRVQHFSSAVLARQEDAYGEEILMAGSSTELQTLQLQIAALNGGERINHNSPRQVAAAVFGDWKQSTNRAVLRLAAAGGFPELDARGRQLASLVLQCRSLTGPRSSPTAAASATAAAATTATATATSISSTLPSSTTNERSAPEGDCVKTIPSDAPPIIDSKRDDELFSYDALVDTIFANPKSQIHRDWRDALRQLSRPSARALVAQLDPEQCPMGYDPLAVPPNALRGYADTLVTSGLATTTAGKKGSFLAYCRQQKKKYPDCILVTRCGDFYETFGLDAILLVEHCGLNAMASKAKAGCPIRNVQTTLDCLTAAGFRVAVYEEGVDTDASAGSGAKVRIKSRFLAQIVSSASPTYLYDLVLGHHNAADALATGPVSRSYVGVLSSRAGYTLTEVSMEERSVRVSERLTAEAVACRLAASSPAEPLLYVPAAGSATLSSSLPFLPSRSSSSSTDGGGVRLRTRILPPALVRQEGMVGGMSEVERAKQVIVSALLQLTERQDDGDDENDDEVPPRRRAALTVDDFTVVSAPAASTTRGGGGTPTNPLHLETATQLGLMNDGAIPSLVASLLPDAAPAATRRFLRRWLLSPPPPAVGAALASVVAFFMHGHGPALPPLSIPPLGKVLAMVRAGQASARVYGELLRTLHTSNVMLDVLARAGDEAPVVQALMMLLEYESGMAADPASLRQRCVEAIRAMEDVLCPIHHVNYSGGRSSAGTAGDVDDDDDDERVSDFGDLVPRAYLERNEATWRGRVRKRAAPDAYRRVQESAEQLARTVATDFWGINEADACMVDNSLFPKSFIVQDIFNNLIALKEIPSAVLDAANYIHPRDRNGKVLRNRYTTEAVQTALSDYVAACDSACGAVSDALVRLSETLHDDGHLPAIVQASHANLILAAAFYHAVQATSLGWSIAETYEATPDLDSAGHFNAVWPYWMDRSQAVQNTFDLNGMWVLTAPNMSGKSTIMRSTAAAALLTICGLCAPLKPGSSIRRFDHIFVRGASSDVPTEQKSAFGAEMGDVAALLRCCGEKSLVFVDELGRGTSPRDGTRLSGAVLEAMAGAGMSGIFATHLHDILNLPLQSIDRVVKKRMAIHERDNVGEECSRYSWTYRLEDGVCTDSMALVTAEKFGLPSQVIQRAEVLAAYLPSTSPVVSPGARTINRPYAGRSDPSPPSFFRDVAQVVEDTTGRRAVEVAAGWSVPAAYDGKSAVYVLKLDTDPARYYVGETDNLRKRIGQHRSKGGIWSNSEALILTAPQGKSQARVWESRLIRSMASTGFDMQSTADGRVLRSMTNDHNADDPVS